MDNPLIVRLRSARALVKSYFDPPACDWQGRFHETRPECDSCTDSGVCAWLFAQDPEPDLASYTHADLAQALMFAIGFLEGSMLEHGHQPSACGCDVCSFVRETHCVVSQGNRLPSACQAEA